VYRRAAEVSWTFSDALMRGKASGLGYVCRAVQKQRLRGVIVSRHEILPEPEAMQLEDWQN
jgi:hypothetical protein